jgi:hypothetical protein
MIKSKELRYGNLIHSAKIKNGISVPATGVFYRVMEINAFHVSCVMDGHAPHKLKAWPGFSYAEVCPIRITPAILEKYGFDENCGRWKIDALPLFEIVDWEKIYHLVIEGDTVVKAIYSVHELQNLVFALTGEELEFKF